MGNDPDSRQRRRPELSRTRRRPSSGSLWAHAPAVGGRALVLLNQGRRRRARACAARRDTCAHALTLRARTGAITRGGRLRACAARQQQQSTRRAVLSQHARCPRTGARVSEAAGWVDRMAACLHSQHREPCHARAAFHRAGLHHPRLSKVVNLQGTASPARVKWKAVAVGLARPGHEPDV